MKVLVPKERTAGENRVAATPETVRRMVKEGFQVAVERGAGAGSHLPDPQYEHAGAELVDPEGLAGAFAEADVVLSVTPPGPNDALGGEEAQSLREGALWIGFASPHQAHDAVRAMRERRISALAMELVPRITRAQSMDALSSQASIAGYKAVLLAAGRLDKYFPLLMTAAGTIQPSRVVVMGAGVAGLQALATARRLGAVVEVSDIRPEVKEQVESLGGRFIDLPLDESGTGEGGYAREVTQDFLRRQQEIVAEHVRECDVIVTTALVPGKPAPKLVTRAMVESMRPGSVLVDLAVAQGGNCELSEPEQEAEHGGVRILGYGNLPATVPRDASTLYARNVLALLLHVAPGAELKLDEEDDIVGGTLLTHEGRICHEPTRAALEQAQGDAS